MTVAGLGLSSIYLFIFAGGNLRVTVLSGTPWWEGKGMMKERESLNACEKMGGSA